MILVYFFFPGRSARPAEEVTFLRILVTTTEFSPNKEAIRHIEETQAAYIHKAKLELVNVLKREAMRQKVTSD